MTSSIDNLEIVTTPTFDWLAQNAKACKSQLLVGSPYVNSGILDLIDLVPKEVDRTLVTRTDLRDFAVGASNLDTLCSLANGGMVVRSLRNLHAKMYIFDCTSALVTSANATVPGMYRNLECGLATKEENSAKQLASLLLKGLGSNRRPVEIKPERLEGMRASVEAIKVTLPVTPFAQNAQYHSQENAPAIEAYFSITDDAALVEGFQGWTRLTLKGVLVMPEGGFQVSDLLAVCGPMAAKEYPKNQNVRPKLRQQLQILRDLGLVEFLGKGFYQRTVN